MDNIRVFLSTIVFAIGCYLLVSLYWVGFDLYLLIGAVLCFCVAHYLLPKDRRKEDDRFDFIDLLEVIVDIPFSIIEFVFKFMLRLFKGKEDSGFDLDL